MEGFDLNLDNYDLADILNLFHLNYDFKKEDMKKAKNIALKTHPDKSNLSKDFFLFFMKAYKMLEAIYEYRYKKEQCAKNPDYEAEVNEENKELLRKLNGKSAKEFNKWFNKMFESVKVRDEDVDTGYGNWFKSNDDLDKCNVKSVSGMEREFNKRKEKSRALILHNDYTENGNNSGYSLTREKPTEYSNDIFSKLRYEDLKKAHTETVVPVTMEDYLSKPKFENVDSYRRHRESTNPSMISLAQSKQMLKERNIKNDKINTERAFRLIKRDEEISQSNKKWWAHLKQLKYQ